MYIYIYIYIHTWTVFLSIFYNRGKTIVPFPQSRVHENAMEMLPRREREGGGKFKTQEQLDTSEKKKRPPINASMKTYLLPISLDRPLSRGKKVLGGEGRIYMRRVPSKRDDGISSYVGIPDRIPRE